MEIFILAGAFIRILEIFSGYVPYCISCRSAIRSHKAAGGHGTAPPPVGTYGANVVFINVVYTFVPGERIIVAVRMTGHKMHVISFNSGKHFRRISPRGELAGLAVAIYRNVHSDDYRRRLVHIGKVFRKP